jgi:hypothetical protein
MQPTVHTPDQWIQLNKYYRACLAASDWPQALTVALRALQAMPGRPKILGDVALCHMRPGNYVASEQGYTQAMQMAHNEASLYDASTLFAARCRFVVADARASDRAGVARVRGVVAHDARLCTSAYA